MHGKAATARYAVLGWVWPFTEPGMQSGCRWGDHAVLRGAPRAKKRCEGFGLAKPSDNLPLWEVHIPEKPSTVFLGRSCRFGLRLAALARTSLSSSSRPSW